MTTLSIVEARHGPSYASILRPVASYGSIPDDSIDPGFVSPDVLAGEHGFHQLCKLRIEPEYICRGSLPLRSFPIRLACSLVVLIHFLSPQAGCLRQVQR